MPLTPADISAGSKKSVFWLGKCGHTWDQVVDKQVKSGKCPFCIGRRVLQGFNDLETTHPEIAREWHPSKNGDLLPTKISKGYTKKVYWLGLCGHEWFANVNNRTAHRRGCPVCSGQIRVAGVNDLRSLRPDLAAEWHPIQNGDLSPTEVGIGTERLVWWLGKCGHEWKASPNNRHSGDAGCPYCSGKRVLAGFNDLATTHRGLAMELHPTLNEDLGSQQISSGSNQKVWWICPKGHEWKAVISSRARGHGCPFCAGQRLIEGENDLATKLPPLANEWHPHLNSELTPKEVTAGSDKVVWWLGKCGHEWPASVGHRARGKGCPVCGGDRVVAGINDMATFYPEIAKEWDSGLNADLKPTMVTSASGKSVWWKGEGCGHTWKAIISNRCLHNSGCPICVGLKIEPGFNDFKTRFPEIADEFHPSKNDPLDLSLVSPNSPEIVWWLGKCGHEWPNSFKNRARGSGCPQCHNTWSKPEKEVLEYVESQLPNEKIIENFRGGFMELLELDIYIENKNLAIEFNGDYWHNESDPAVKDRHMRKLEKCIKNNVKLAVVWESDWLQNREGVCELLSKFLISGESHPLLTYSREM